MQTSKIIKKLRQEIRKSYLKYANEDLITEILTVIDHLELSTAAFYRQAMHPDALAEGVRFNIKGT